MCRVSRRWFEGVVYNLELESNDPTPGDDLFWVEGNSGVVTHNCLPKDLAQLIGVYHEALGPNAVVMTAAQIRNLKDRNLPA